MRLNDGAVSRRSCTVSFTPKQKPLRNTRITVNHFTDSELNDRTARVVSRMLMNIAVYSLR